LAALGGAVAQNARQARMGWLSGGPGARPRSPLLVLKDELQGLGWKLGETLHIEERHANGDTASLSRLAAELVTQRPDVIGAT